MALERITCLERKQDVIGSEIWVRQFSLLNLNCTSESKLSQFQFKIAKSHYKTSAN